MALIATVRAVTGAPTPKHLGRLMEGPFQVVVPGAHQALFWHARGVISGLPARDNCDGSDPPRGCCASVSCATPPCPHRAAKRGGSLPSTSDFPDRQRRHREAIRNPNGDSRLEKSLRARRRGFMVHMLPVVSCALPDRHGTPLFSGQVRPPGSQLERQITKPAGRTTTAGQRNRPDAGCRLSPAR